MSPSSRALGGASLQQGSGALDQVLQTLRGAGKSISHGLMSVKR